MRRTRMPRVTGDTLQFVYLCDPTRLVDDQAQTVAESIPPIAAGPFRGGSQLIAFDGGWLALVHEARIRDTQREYRHRFVWFDEATGLQRVSRPFYFHKHGVEFAAGLAWHPDARRLLVSYGVDDAEAWLATVEAEDVRPMLDDVEQLTSGRKATGGRLRQVLSCRHGALALSSFAGPTGNSGSRAAKIGFDVMAAEADWVSGQTNRALRNSRAIEHARAATERLCLPLHRDPPKAWDNFIALYQTMATTEPDRPVLDAGGARYSAYLPALDALGYTNLTAINLIEGEPEKVKSIVYRYGDITKTDFSGRSFGFVACLSVIEHGVDWRLFLQEVARILRPGGHLFVSMDYWEGPIGHGRYRRPCPEFGVPVKIFACSRSHGSYWICVRSGAAARRSENADAAMRRESNQLARTSGYHYFAACYRYATILTITHAPIKKRDNEVLTQLPRPNQ